MTLDEHAQHLGELVGQFQSLEFLLRVFLQELPSARPVGIPYGTDIYSYPVGSELPLSELTSYDSLGTLVGHFNAEMERRGLPEIDSRLVEVRDALAHGRVSASIPSDTLRLLKFDRPRKGKVRVVFNAKLTAAWFADHRKRVDEAIRFVADHEPSASL